MEKNNCYASNHRDNTMRRIIFYICLLCIFQASCNEISKNKNLEQRARRIFRLQWERTAHRPLSEILIDQWNSGNSKEELVTL